MITHITIAAVLATLTMIRYMMNTERKPTEKKLLVHYMTWQMWPVVAVFSLCGIIMLEIFSTEETQEYKSTVYGHIKNLGKIMIGEDITEQ